MYGWIGRAHGLDTVLVNIFVVFVRVLIVLFRKSNVYAWIGRTHGLDVRMGWTYA